MKIFRRPTDPTEAVLRKLSKRLRWFRPSLADAPTASDQLVHLAQHRLCPAIDQGDPAPLVTAFAIIEEALGETPDDKLDDELIGLIETVSNWVSWPETPPAVIEALETAIGPATRERWNRVRRQSTLVAGWLRAGNAPDRTDGGGDFRAIQNPDLRFLLRSTKQYIDDTLTVNTADRLRHELATGQGM